MIYQLQRLQCVPEWTVDGIYRQILTHLFAHPRQQYTKSSVIVRRFVSLNILLSHSRSFEMTLLSRACVSSY